MQRAKPLHPWAPKAPLQSHSRTDATGLPLVNGLFIFPGSRWVCKCVIGCFHESGHRTDAHSATVVSKRGMSCKQGASAGTLTRFLCPDKRPGVFSEGIGSRVSVVGWGHVHVGLREPFVPISLPRQAAPRQAPSRKDSQLSSGIFFPPLSLFDLLETGKPKKGCNSVSTRVTACN